MKRFLLILAVLFVLMLPAGASAQVSNTTFIPELVSAGGSFIAIQEPALTGSIRLSWTVFESGSHGLFPKMDDRFVCYFSDSDSKATCGPTPFPLPTTGLAPYTMYVEAIGPAGVIGNITQPVNSGGIEFTVTTQLLGNTLYLVVAAKGSLPQAVHYAVYETDLTEIVPETDLIYDISTDRFNANITLANGEYYLAIWGATAGEADFGGDLMRLVIGPVGAGGVPGVAGVVEAEPVILKGVLLSKGSDYTQRGFNLINTGGSTVPNISVSVPGDLADVLSVELDDYTLEVNDSTLFTIKLSDVQSSMQINTNAEILSASEVIGVIPIEIGVSILGADTGVCPECPTIEPTTDAFTVAPQIWTGEYSLTDGASTIVAITAGDAAITNIGFQAGGALAGLASADLPDSVGISDTDTGTITVSAYAAGTYTGTLTIDSDQGSQAMLATLSFYGDVEGDLEAMRTSVENLVATMPSTQLASLSGVITDIGDLLDDADSKIAAGDYSSAQNKIDQADTKLRVVEGFVGSGVSPGTPTGPTVTTGGIDFVTIILIVVMVAIVGAIAFVFLKGRKKKPKKLEEELQEEF